MKYRVKQIGNKYYPQKKTIFVLEKHKGSYMF